MKGSEDTDKQGKYLLKPKKQQQLNSTSIWIKTFEMHLKPGSHCDFFFFFFFFFF